jgi:hypothetical protein
MELAEQQKQARTAQRVSNCVPRRSSEAMRSNQTVNSAAQGDNLSFIYTRRQFTARERQRNMILRGKVASTELLMIWHDPAQHELLQTPQIRDSFDVKYLRWYTASYWGALRLAVSVGGAVESVHEGAEKSCRGWKKEPPDLIVQPKLFVRDAHEVKKATPEKLRR